MWKRTFIRIFLVLLVATAGLLVVAAANKKMLPGNSECASSQEKCSSSDETGQGEFLIWESLNRNVLSAIDF